MAEVQTERVQVWEVLEAGYGGQQVVRGRFTTQEEAAARFHAVLRAEPHLLGCLGCAVRQVELVVPAPPAAAAPPPALVVTD